MRTGKSKLSRIVVLCAILLLMAAIAHAQDAVNITTGISTTELRAGQVADAVMQVRNVQIPAEAVLVAECSYTLPSGETREVSSEPLTLKIIHPLQVQELRVALPGLDYVSNSANIDGTAVAATWADNVLVVPINRELLDLEQVEMKYQVRGR